MHLGESGDQEGYRTGLLRQSPCKPPGLCPDPLLLQIT